MPLKGGIETASLTEAYGEFRSEPFLPTIDLVAPKVVKPSLI